MRSHVLYRLVKNGIGNSGASAIGQALVRNSSLTWLRYGLDLMRVCR